MLNFIFSVSFGLISLAWPLSNNQQVSPIVISAPNVTIHGYRYLNRAGEPNNGPKILLTHGLTSNQHEFDGLAAALASRGFDCYAFNFRGHGNGAERTTVTEYTSGEYSFEQMAKVDFPAMVDYVSNHGAEKISLIGHSMGGMVPRAAMAEGYVNPELISKFVLIASPSTFDQMSLPFPSLQVHEMPLWIGAGDQPILGNSLINLGAQMLSEFSNPLLQWMVRGVVRTENFNEHDSWKELAKSNSVPKDIFRSFSTFRSRRFKYESAKLPVPALHILGSDDQLAPWREVVKQSLIQSEEAGAWFVLLDKVSHVDLVAERVVATYEHVLFKFLEAPESLGEKNGLLNLKLDICELLLSSKKPI